MTEKNGIYKCAVCGNIVSVEDANAGELVCCGKPMNLMPELTKESEGSTEKHVPLIEVNGNKVKVTVGDVPHPMEEAHFIEFIQLLQDGNVVAEKRLFPEQKPEAEFYMENTKGITAREFCNVHGLWKSG